MTVLLRALTGAIGPYLIGAIGLLLLALLMAFGVQTWRLHASQVTEAKAASAMTSLSAERDRARDNRVSCENRLRLQSGQIRDLSAAANLSVRQASAAASKMLTRPLAPPPSNEDARGMNQWLDSVLLSSR